MSKSVGADAQGELQGAIASLVGFTAILTLPLMTQLFRLFSAEDAPVHFPGAPFFTAAVCLVGSMALVARTLSSGR